MNREALEARIKELMEAHEKARDQVAMLKGALSECRRLIAVLEEEHNASEAKDT